LDLRPYSKGAHQGTVSALALSSDGRVLVTGRGLLDIALAMS
jgi:hypothetical protein